MSDLVTLTILEGLYYSQHDENVFYKWLKRVRSVVRLHGESDKLFIEVRADKFDQKDLREMLALFRRYNIDLTALANLEHDTNRPWLCDESKWWYPLVFKGRRRRMMRRKAR
jgi:hypothetical protein